MPSAIGMMMGSYPTNYNGGDRTSSVRKGKGNGKAQIKKERDQGFVIPLYLYPPTLPPPRTKPRRRPKKKTARPPPPFCLHHEILHNRHHHHHRHQDHGQHPPRHHPTRPLSLGKERGPTEVGGHENQGGQGPTRTPSSDNSNNISSSCSCNSSNRLSCTTSSSGSSSSSSTYNGGDNNSNGSNGKPSDHSLGLLIQKAWAFRSKSILHPDSSSVNGSSCTSDLSCRTSSSGYSSSSGGTCSSNCSHGSNNTFGTLQVLLGSMLPLKRERNGQQNRGHCICCCNNQCDPVSCTDPATSLATGQDTVKRPLVSAMKRAGQPPRAILSAPGNGRVSFECDLRDRTTRPHRQPTTTGNYGRFSPPTVARTEPLSSSAPSALFLYQPFSSDKGPPSPLVKELDRPQSRKRGFDRFDSTTNATVPTTVAVGGGRGERTRLVPLNLTTNDNGNDNNNDNDNDSDYDNNDVTTKVQDQVVPQEQTSVQQQQSVRASTTTKATATTAPSTTITASSRASQLSSSSTSIAPSSSSETAVTTISTTDPSPASIVSSFSTSTRADSKTKTSSHHHQSTKDQRRQSSEDGLTTPTTHDLAIPTKCRMVFHMRDEVSKIKGHCAADGGSANFRPLPQPRQWQSVPQYPLRATTSLKTTKTVSFQEPEPWKKRCSEEIISTSFVLTSKNGDEVSPQRPTILVKRPTFESEHSDSHEPILLTYEKAAPTGRAKTENATTATATPATNVVTRPPPASAPATRSSAAMEHRGHVRNLSAPSPPASSSMTERTMETKPLPMTRTSTSNSSTSYNISVSNSTGKGSPPTSSGGNRFSRLWKSMAQKVGNGHGHTHRHSQDENSCHSTNKYHHHIHHSQIVQGSDLEPLVVNAN